jgi:hypothetical protein
MPGRLARPVGAVSSPTPTSDPVAVHLASVITELEAALDSPAPAAAAAKKLEDVMEGGVDRAIGAGGRLRNFKGPPVKLDGESKPSLAWLDLGGATYNLADKGRRKKRARIWPKHGTRSRAKNVRKTRGRVGHRPTLRTPAGFRYTVKGSTSRGKRITDTYAPRALEQATVEAQRVVVEIFARTV